MDWSEKQAHILTGGGQLDLLFQAPLFPFTADELAHHYLLLGDTHAKFLEWQRAGKTSTLVNYK